MNDFHYGVRYDKLYILAEASRSRQTVTVEKDNFLLTVLCRTAYLFATVNNNGHYRLIWKGDLDNDDSRSRHQHRHAG